MTRGIFLTGFSGSGKSTIAYLVGRRLGWPIYDLDQVIVERSGMTIPLIFEQEGEPGFRLREAEALRAVTAPGPFVVATGGGTPLREENRRFMASRGWIICLEGRPETLLSRIRHQLKESGPDAIRPMLDAIYPLDQVRALKQSRQSVYALADWTIHTDRLTPAEVAQEVIRAVRLLERAPEPSPAQDPAALSTHHSLSPDLPPPITVDSGPWPYKVVVGWRHLHMLGNQLRHLLPHARRVGIIADEIAWNRAERTIVESVEAAGLKPRAYTMQADEHVKTTKSVDALYDRLIDLQLRRDDIIMVVGGGALDDLGSFVASTYMRGVALVKVPTSLEGMVDGSIGGKTALNHPRYRNLIGTFFHPRLVWSDASLLLAEPARQLRAAWAEVVKYAMLESSLLRDQVVGTTFFDQLERQVDELLNLRQATLLDVISRCVALKARVVSVDERDSGQYRMLLNFGHTMAHALQAASDYELVHGEAVAIGMAVEARLAVRLGLADASVEARQNELLGRFGLPTRVPRLSRASLLDCIRHDKKVLGDMPRWIMPVAVGRAVVSGSVTDADLVAVLEECALS